MTAPRSPILEVKAHSGSGGPALPAPGRERWQPLRSGVLNLYRYDYEEFHYEQGRLLLRGNNGSGKSRVLALQLPFLLDGEVSPARVEPDGDAAKRIEWNLLMGRHKDRTGYTWIEFGRRDAHGVDHFFTLGCGLRAVEGHTGLHTRWFFTTTLRIGRDLFLQNHQRTPLGRERLAEVIGASGQVYQKAEAYRQVVDQTLFGLGPRYGALIELLIRLRRPQLTRKLDENELPDALGDALPTLAATIVEEVAESFRGLQADKDTVRDFTAAREAVAAFLREYAVYVRIAVRRRAAEVRTANSAYEGAQRAAKDAAKRLEAAEAALASLQRQREELDTRLAGAEADERTLANSPEMRTADEIRLAGEAAQAAADALVAAKADEEKAAGALQLAQARQNLIEEQFAAFEENLAGVLRAAASAANAAALDDAHREHFSDDQPPRAYKAAEVSLKQTIAKRLESLRLLVKLEDAATEAGRALAQAEGELRQAEAKAGEARLEEHNARDNLAAAGAGLIERYTAWQAAARLLRPIPPSSLADNFASWLDRREGPGPLRLAAQAAHQQAISALAARETDLRQTAGELARNIDKLNTEIDLLETGETRSPPPPATRGSDRSGRPGAPLWRVCDFRPEVEPAARAGMEAALQSSGLLDAWILPDGGVLGGEEDTFLVPPPPHAGINAPSAPLCRHLGNLLVPAIDPESVAAKQLSAQTISHLLERIGSAPGESEHWMSVDGAWRLGPMSGRWTKPDADFIGESTRAAARRRQLALLRASLAEAEAALRANQALVASVAEDRVVATAEFEAAPSEEPVLLAGYQLGTAVRQTTQAFVAFENAAKSADARRAEAEQKRARLQQDAADLKLAGWLGHLPALTDATQHYATSLATLWPTLGHAETIASQLAQAREQTAAAETEFTGREERRLSAALKAEAALRHFKTLEESHGQSVKAILEKHQAAKTLVESLKKELRDNDTQRVDQATAHARAQENQTTANQKRTDQEALRGEAITRLRQLAAQRLLVDADSALAAHDFEEEWSVSGAVEIARDIETRLSEVPSDDSGWQQRQDQIHGHIQDLRDRLTSHGHAAETHQVQDVVLVRCVFQARVLTMTELHAAFSSEIEARGRLLQEREREIIENHLLAEAAVELQKLIRAAELWRASANEELYSRPTSTGVRFRFQWEADTEIRFHEVRPILLKKGELWTPAERAAVAAFLQGRIAAEQTADESGSWRDHLARALDYRRWHRFVIERQQEGQWRRLNKTTYGTGSGGEKALALTLPRFAAAAAHYKGAASTAPRLVMLDEAFAGIDPTMRAQCLGVLTQFDLDVVMTSELEWGCYATVPALAIYHLTTLPGLDAVGCTRWLWNGREKRQIDHPEPQAGPPEPLAGATDELPFDAASESSPPPSPDDANGTAPPPGPDAPDSSAL